MKSLDEYFTSEDIDIQGDRVVFNYNKSDKVNIDTSLGKSTKNIKFAPRKTTLKNSRVKAYSIYYNKGGETSTAILKALKRTKDSRHKVEAVDYELFIKRSAIFFLKYLKKKKIDTIFAMSSSSSLVDDIVKEVRSKLSDISIKTFDNAINKNIENLTIDPGNLSDSEYRNLTKAVEKAKSTGKFEIKKFSGKHRRFLTNWIEVNKEVLKEVEGKNVIVFDDYLTTGSTLDEVCSTLLKLSPKSLEVFTMIKS